MNWNIEWLRLDLRYTWKISRNASDFKENAVISVKHGEWTGIGEVAPNIRYNETRETIQQAFDRFKSAAENRIHDLQDLEHLLSELKLPNALRFGVESAFIHMLCHAEKTSVHTLLNIEKADKLPTAYSFPIMETAELQSFYENENLSRFPMLKVKINRQNAQETLDAIGAFATAPLIIDANESFHSADEVAAFMNTLTRLNVACIEQPMPSHLSDEYKKLKPNSPYLLMADESVCDDADFDEIALQFHGVNMKLMKAGGYLNGLRILHEARKRKLKTMVGCMIETSLGISSAMNVSAAVDIVDLDGFLILKHDPFNLIHEEHGFLKRQ
ncbi:MAG: enolase C-terminal domain-like protein [Bacteroidota bacterium]|jgi:L-alanine-DL-glutamate epimerase-like enolase superfamily enzyme